MSERIEQAAKGTHDRVKSTVMSLNQGASAKALDAPCGHGGLATALKEHGYSVDALDIVPPQGVAEGITVAQHDLNERLPFADSSFDLCVSVEGIEHLERPADFFHELARVLKPGGDLVLSTPNTESLHSRFRTLRNGFPKNFAPTSETERDSGHIHPIDRIFIERHRRLAGLEIVEIASNYLYGKKFPWPLLAGLLTRRLPAMYRNEHVLYGDVLVYHFRKP